MYSVDLTAFDAYKKNDKKNSEEKKNNKQVLIKRWQSNSTVFAFNALGFMSTMFFVNVSSNGKFPLTSSKSRRFLEHFFS